MKKNLFYCCLTFLSTALPSWAGLPEAEGLPDFELHSIQLTVPPNLPSYPSDPQNAEGIYRFRGQFFLPAEQREITAQTFFAESEDADNPYASFVTMMQSYHSGEMEKILALYTPQSQDRVHSLLQSPEVQANWKSFTTRIKKLTPILVLELQPDELYCLVRTNDDPYVTPFGLKKISEKKWLFFAGEMDDIGMSNINRFLVERGVEALHPEIVR